MGRVYENRRKKTDVRARREVGEGCGSSRSSRSRISRSSRSRRRSGLLGELLTRHLSQFLSWHEWSLVHQGTSFCMPSLTEMQRRDASPLSRLEFFWKEKDRKILSDRSIWRREEKRREEWKIGDFFLLVLLSVVHPDDPNNHHYLRHTHLHDMHACMHATST